MTTHPNQSVLTHYAAGGPELDDATVWSVEVHLETCADCRARLAGAAVPASALLLDRVAAALDEALDTEPAPARASRPWSAVRFRWFAGTVVPWLVMTFAVLGVALLLDSASSAWPSLVLLLAPLAPLPGVAAAWSRRTDPAWELIAGTPAAGPVMLLRRTAAVLTVVIPVLALAGVVSGNLLGTNGPTVSLALTLLPSLACTAATIALGGRIGIPRAASAIGAAWAAVVIAPSLATQNLSVALGPSAVPAWAVATAALVAYALTRGDDYRRLTSRS